MMLKRRRITVKETVPVMATGAENPPVRGCDKQCLALVCAFEASPPVSWLCHTREIKKRRLMLHASSSGRLIGNPLKMTCLIRSWFLE